MELTWTPLHRALGRTRGPLDATMITEAVEQHLAENQELEWKRDLPTRDGGQGATNEFCKDVAAMANSTGGLIIYGMREGGTGAEQGRASDVVPIELSERIEQRLRQLATQVEPAIAGLVVGLVPTTEDGSRGVVALLVPASSRTPHFVQGRGDNSFVAPVRSGANTHWLSERDIERHYSARFSLQDQTRTDLADLVEGTRRQLLFGEGAWLILTSRPLGPAPVPVEPPDRGYPRDVVTTVERLRVEHSPEVDPWLRASSLPMTLSNPIAGLRRWRVTFSADDPQGRTRDTLIELHHNGDAVLAVQGARYLRIDDERLRPSALSRESVRPVIRDFVVLATEHALRRGHSGSLALRADVIWDPGVPTATCWTIITFGRQVAAFASRVEGSLEVMRFEPIGAEISVHASTEEMASVADGLSLDVLSQFNVTTMP